MTTEITLEWDSRDLSFWLSDATTKALTSAVSKAGGEAARAMKAASSRSVRQRKRLKVARINRSLPLTFPKSRALEDLAWRMDVLGTPIPVVDYAPRQVRQGVTVGINTGGRKLIKSAFLATMRSGHKGVFLRDGKHRLPIEETFTTRVSDVFKDNGMVPAVYERTQRVFKSSFERLMTLELAKVHR